jgi:hypothetical protein
MFINECDFLGFGVCLDEMFLLPIITIIALVAIKQSNANCPVGAETVTHWRCVETDKYDLPRPFKHVGVEVYTKSGCRYLIHNLGKKSGNDARTHIHGTYDEYTYNHATGMKRGWCEARYLVTDFQMRDKGDSEGTWSLWFNTCYQVRNRMVALISGGPSCDEC